jgi:MFS family permease
MRNGYSNRKNTAGVFLQDLPGDGSPLWRMRLSSWELYAMWAFVAVFFADFFLARGASGARADRLGRERVAIRAMAVSGACALVIGRLIDAPLPLVLTVALVWGFAVVADSAQFSAVVTEVAPAHAVGTALTFQTAPGFLLTAVTLTAVPPLREAGGWPLAFGVLALGPAVGIAAMRRLEAIRIRGRRGGPDRARLRSDHAGRAPEQAAHRPGRTVPLDGTPRQH